MRNKSKRKKKDTPSARYKSAVGMGNSTEILLAKSIFQDTHFSVCFAWLMTWTEKEIILIKNNIYPNDTFQTISGEDLQKSDRKLIDEHLDKLHSF